MSWAIDQMVARAAREVHPWSVVNLGIGLPTRLAEALPEGTAVWLQSENGLLGMGPAPAEGEEDPQLINAGKQVVTMRAGASLFDSSLSFAMIRGGHVDLAVLGALQVSKQGDLANWAVPQKRVMGIGGAMDLAAGARRVVVLTRHTAKSGEPKLLSRLSYPVTALGCVDRVITELGVFDPLGDAFGVVERAPGVTDADLVAATAAPLHF